MSLIRNPDKGVLATPFGSWMGGETLTNLHRIPRPMLQSWIETKEVIDDGKEPEPDEMVEEDVLSGLSRQELLNVIRLNDLKGRSKASWSDEAVRQMIRDEAGDSLSALKLPTSVAAE